MIPRIDVTPGAGLSSETHRITSEDTRSMADDFVPLITLDDAFGRDRLWPTIVKVDVEGHEIAVVEGARRIIERSEEHTSELQSLMRISYAVFCLKKKKKQL